MWTDAKRLTGAARSRRPAGRGGGAARPAEDCQKPAAARSVPDAHHPFGWGKVAQDPLQHRAPSGYGERGPPAPGGVRRRLGGWRRRADLGQRRRPAGRVQSSEVLRWLSAVGGMRRDGCSSCQSACRYAVFAGLPPRGGRPRLLSGRARAFVVCWRRPSPARGVTSAQRNE